MQGVGCRVQGVGDRESDHWSMVRVWCSVYSDEGCGVWNVWCRVQGVECKVQGGGPLVDEEGMGCSVYSDVGCSV